MSHESRLFKSAGVRTEKSDVRTSEVRTSECLRFSVHVFEPHGAPGRRLLRAVGCCCLCSEATGCCVQRSERDLNRQTVDGSANHGHSPVRPTAESDFFSFRFTHIWYLNGSACSARVCNRLSYFFSYCCCGSTDLLRWVAP